MKKKNLLILIIFGFLVASGVGFYFLVLRKPAKTTPKPEQISWQFEDVGLDPISDCRLTKVKLEIGGKIYDVGTYTGADCSAMAVNLLSEDEISGAVCWCAGGEEIGVFKEDGKLMVKKRGVGADFETILEIK